LVATTSDDVSFAGAFAGDLVAPSVVDGAEGVASASFASVGVVHVSIPKTGFASVASAAFDVPSADASSGDEVVDGIGSTFALAVVLGSDGIAVAGLTGVGVANVALRILEETRTTLLTVATHRIVGAIVADAAGTVARGNVHGHVEMTSGGVTVAFASLTGVS
jgi:hypothetical protein